MHTNSTSPIPLTGSFKYYNNIPYDKYNRTTMDLFVPPSGTPVGVLLHFHGGGFVVGAKDPSQYSSSLVSEIQTLLNNGIAFAHVNYRLMIIDGAKENLLKTLKCGPKAIKFAIANFSDYNIDVTKIGLQGSSGGNGHIMHYLHNQTGTIKSIALLSPQASYDPLEPILINEGFDIIADMEAYNNSKKTYLRGCGIKNIEDLNRPDIVQYRNSVNYVNLPFTATIGEAYVETLNQPTPLENNPTLVTHHFRNCINIHNKLQAVPVVSSINIPTAPAPLTVVNTESKIDFLIRTLG